MCNQNNKKLILSINCESKLNVRVPGKKWKGWKSVEKDFEKNIINDLC